ncbi:MULTISPECIES: DUF7521 family protein [Haloarcula]|uniref:DUF7521 family protein n=1 Tax=Haloarcula TaxID=2237 RepID=UPI0023E7B37C|nr:hypothetical protein [Halomicroarcula sp. SHR3]
MPSLSTVFLVAAKTLTLACGVVLTTLTYRAYRRTRSTAMRVLSVGIGLVTAGAVLAGSLNQLAGVPIVVSTTIESVFTAAGFLVMTYSLYSDRLAGT